MSFAKQRSEGQAPASELRLAVLDMSGTTVTDGGLVEEAFAGAVAPEGVLRGSERFHTMLEYFRENMGLSKISVFQNLFSDSPEKAERVNRSFEQGYDQVISAGGLQAIPGAEATIDHLRSDGIKVCLSTGFARHTQNSMLESLGWMGLADLSLCPADAGRGGPYPDIILTAVLALDLADVRQVLVLGDTTSDIQSGLRSGASLVVGVRTGVHTEAALRVAGAHDVVPSVAELPTLLVG
ncbi:phosphonatase-like hydrolase [Psychromicrobium silvestre]|uniref:Phosphonatase-like hydrolase n=1 Tax=Psychromicrobium silvestre TaxID=1645614 RepID=A0A7Y9S7T4_9MICC|nr:HAD family hydrolase [Psychromicrobium silvestre]NYE96259.1 phosphonatase-like hydrolase [Psychromicrobium silvestre]